MAKIKTRTEKRELLGPFPGEELGSRVTQWLGLRSTSVPSGIFIHSAVWPHTHIGQKLGTVHLFGAGLPSNTTSLGRGLPPYQVPSLSIQPFGHNRPAEIWGSLSPFGGGVLDSLGPHLTHNVAWAEAYLPTKWHLDPSSHLTKQIWAENWGLRPILRRSWVPI